MKIHSYIINAEYNVTESCTDIIKRSQHLYLSGRAILSTQPLHSVVSHTTQAKEHQCPPQSGIPVPSNTSHSKKIRCGSTKAIFPYEHKAPLVVWPDRMHVLLA